MPSVPGAYSLHVLSVLSSSCTVRFFSIKSSQLEIYYGGGGLKPASKTVRVHNKKAR
jgi:hypothetical protein